MLMAVSCLSWMRAYKLTPPMTAMITSEVRTRRQKIESRTSLCLSREEELKNVGVCKPIHYSGRSLKQIVPIERPNRARWSGENFENERLQPRFLFGIPLLPGIKLAHEQPLSPRRPVK